MDKVNHWKKELYILHAILRKSGLKEEIKWGAPVFTLNGKNIVSFAGFKHHFALWFYQGVFLSDPFKVLISAKGEKTKALRQWRFQSIQEIEEDKIIQYVQEAIENSINGKEIKPEKFKEVRIPKELNDALNESIDFQNAYHNLSPGKKKEYNLFIEEAKQEKTKLARIEKIRPLILANLGLNDQYKNKSQHIMF